ncbi:hypothetical protein D1007_05522 [Hordeum vulgare]|nr:hypothetical protein D1007_05522 [Hordeum vulgare]
MVRRWAAKVWSDEAWPRHGPGRQKEAGALALGAESRRLGLLGCDGVRKGAVMAESVFSHKRNATDVYQVKYERLPLFCLSCGCVGHSSVLCPSPGVRDAEGLLPYHSSRLCFQNDRKKMPAGAKSCQNSFSKNTAPGSRGGVHALDNMQPGVGGKDIAGEGIPPLKPRKPRATRAKKVAASDVNMRRSDGSAGSACAGSLAPSSGQKHKEYQPIVPVQQDVQETSPLPMILVSNKGSPAAFQTTISDNGQLPAVETNKKQRTSTSTRSAD